MALAWLELQAAIAARIGEPEDVPGGISPTGEVDLPYYSQGIIEGLLLEISNQMLLEVPSDELEAIGSPAITTSIYPVSGQALAAGTLKILTCVVHPLSTSTEYVATQPMVPAIYVQTRNSDPKLIAGWSVFNGGFYFIGFDAQVTAISRPSLGSWQSNPSPPILPDGSDEARIDWVCRQMQVMNFLPKGGV